MGKLTITHIKSDDKFKKDFKGEEFEPIYIEPFCPPPLKFSWKEFKEAFGKMKDRNNINKYIDLKTMEWNSINEKRPVDGSRVLVCDIYYRQVRILTYNEYEDCWDREDGDDFYCDIDRCPYWTELPKYKE